MMLFGILCAGAPDAAEVYRWRDNNGVLHYSDRPPAEGDFESGSLPEAGTTRVVSAPRFEPGRSSPRKRRKESAPDSNHRKICDKLRARTGKIRHKLREGYQAAAGERLKSEMRRLRKQIFREC